MIERFIANRETLKRIGRFKTLRRAYFSWWLFLVLTFIGATAEVWSNNKPIIMTYQSSIYFPVFKSYHPSRFNQEGFVTDYRKLNPDLAIWPIVKWDPYETNDKISTYPSEPTNANWLGTDDRGRDVLARIIYGFRTSMIFAILVWILAFGVGIFAGALMGYWGGLVDLIGQRIVEVFDSLPHVLVLLTLVALLGASMELLIGFSVLLGWMRISLYMRAEFLKLRKRDFVESGKAQGLSSFRILFRHILPNALGPVITFSPTEIASSIYMLAILDYLGLGLPPPTASWGELLRQAQNEFNIAWWLAIYPSLSIVITLTALTFIGEGVRVAFDPRK
jgi:microcin C transport system permease protein